MSTPKWDADMIRANRKRATGSYHIGGNLWITVCPDCPEESITAGVVPRYRTIGPHQVEAHGALIPGINVGMLP